MSFGGQSTSSNLAFKKFETADEVEERKRVRQEQWEKVRKSDDPIERPEEDDRSLFEKLQDQKDRKQQEYEDQFKFSNQVKGLDEEEANFLEEVSQRQMEIEKERLSEETSILREMRDANVAKLPDDKTKKENEKGNTKPVPIPTTKKSQQSLLMGAVKRKSSDSQVESKKPRPDDTNPSSSSQSESRIGAGPSGEDSQDPPRDSVPVANSEISVQDRTVSGSGVAQVIGILPGIGNYSDDSSDSNSSNSSCDWDDLLTATKVKRVIITTKEH